MKDFEDYKIKEITGAKVCKFYEDGVEYETAEDVYKRQGRISCSTIWFQRILSPSSGLRCIMRRQEPFLKKGCGRSEEIMMTVSYTHLDVYKRQ